MHLEKACLSQVAVRRFRQRRSYRQNFNTRFWRAMTSYWLGLPLKELLLETCRCPRMSPSSIFLLSWTAPPYHHWRITTAVLVTLSEVGSILWQAQRKIMVMKTRHRRLWLLFSIKWETRNATASKSPRTNGFTRDPLYQVNNIRLKKSLPPRLSIWTIRAIRTMEPPLVQKGLSGRGSWWWKVARKRDLFNEGVLSATDWVWKSILQQGWFRITLWYRCVKKSTIYDDTNCFFALLF